MLKTFIIRFVFFSFLWFVLNGAKLLQPGLAILIILGATYSSMLLWNAKPLKLNPLGIISFLPFFISRSVLGGVDVAIRAFKPSLPVNPGIKEFELQLNEPAAIFFLCFMFSLLPGTAVINQLDRRITVHVLDMELDTEHMLRELEEKIQGMYYPRT